VHGVDTSAREDRRLTSASAGICGFCRHSLARCDSLGWTARGGLRQTVWWFCRRGSVVQQPLPARP